MAFLRRNPGRPRVLRKDRTGFNPVMVGLLALLLAAVVTYFGFAKHVPFTHGFRVRAVFNNANSVKKNSPVRIAGVNVGKVKKIERYKDTRAALVTFELTKEALPIHKDATLKIRPRIFLEGNFFIDLRPGTPGTPTIGDNETIPMTNTTAPVQFGDVLTALQQDTRKSLQNTLAGLGTALTVKPDAAGDAAADPSARGQTAAQSINDSYDDSPSALRSASIVNDAFLGVERHDLSGLVKGLATVTGALDRNERQLQDFVTNFNSTVKIFADESTNLGASIHKLPRTLRSADRTFANLNRAFPPTRAFAREILPGVRATPGTIDAAYPWIRQVRALLRPSELQGLVRELSPATRDLSKTVDATQQFLPQQNLVAKCATDVILPTGDIKIQDGALSTGAENYKEFWYTMVGLAGEGQNFDGNGMYVRFQAGGGTQTLSTGASSLSGEQLFGKNDFAPVGTRPAYTGVRPPHKPDVPCFTQKIPDLNGAATGKAEASKNNGSGPTITAIPGTQGLTIPNISPSLPPLPNLGGLLPGARAKAPSSGGLAGEIADRLNPFRSGGNKGAGQR